MYILPPKKYSKFEKIFQNKKHNDSETIFKKIKKDLKWIKVNYGEVLIFNQCLPHGNIVNQTSETRWTFNCRFKGLFTPYNDKKIGEFFQPITMRPISQNALNYKFPKNKMKKLRGYIFSRAFMGERVPQSIQNLVIREFCKKNNYSYLLSAAEYAMNDCSLLGFKKYCQ